ncbi:hypothetical protein ACQPZX_05050 [Actinoplanes sp. CA-142083]|uniref:hypothetical protein n=1 Tax=Actinoplanes sp. CA-142083 TaxID=3239903 RepID=UPI003D8C1EC5
MRHIRSILYSLVLAPAAWVLTGVGLTGDLTARGRDGFAVESFTGLLLLLLAGAAYGILVLGPISPAGPLLAGVVYLAIAVWSLMSPSSYADVWPPSVAKDGFDLSRPGYGLAALLAVPLICTALSARRWAKYEPPVLPLIGQIGRARGAAPAQGIPLAVVQTTVIGAPPAFPSLDADPTTVLRLPPPTADSAPIPADETTTDLPNPAPNATPLTLDDELTIALATALPVSALPASVSPADEETVVTNRAKSEQLLEREAALEGEATTEPETIAESKTPTTNRTATEGETVAVFEAIVVPEPEAATDSDADEEPTDSSDGEEPTDSSDGEEPTAAVEDDEPPATPIEDADEATESVALAEDDTAEAGAEVVAEPDAEQDAEPAVEEESEISEAVAQAEPVISEAVALAEGDPETVAQVEGESAADVVDDEAEAVIVDEEPADETTVVAFAAVADKSDVIPLPVGDVAERTQVVRLPVKDQSERTQVVRLPVGDAAERTQVVRLPVGESAEVVQLPVGDGDSRTHVVPFPSVDQDEKTQVIKLPKPGDTTQVLQFPVRSPGAEPGQRTRDLSNRATRDVGGDETQVIRLADKTVDDEKTQVIRPALVSRPGETTDVLKFRPPVPRNDAPVPNSIADAEAPNFAEDPTSPIVPPSADEYEEATRPSKRSMTVMNMERPQDELADEPTRALEIPTQRRPHDND